MTTFTIQTPVTETATTPATYAGHPDFLNEPQAAAALLCARVHFRNGVKDGRFPKPVILSPRKRFWIKSELEALIQKAIESRGEIHNGVTTELQNECECFGLCPVCHSAPDYLLTVNRHMCVCHKHKVCWDTNEYEFFRSEDNTPIEILQFNEEFIKTYEVVEPYYYPSNDIDDSPF